MSITVTTDGFKKLKAELEHLKKTTRPAIIDAIAVAREQGDLKENAEYIAAREEQVQIESRINEIENILSNLNIVDPTKFSGKNIMFGAYVDLVNEDTGQQITYRVVSELESDISKGNISYTSPIGKALIGKEEGELVTVIAPGGEKNYEILKVYYS